jgi:hypothetical protein
MHTRMIPPGSWRIPTTGPRYSLNFLYYPNYEENGQYSSLPGYALTNFRVGIESEEKGWRVDLTYHF